MEYLILAQLSKWRAYNNRSPKQRETVHTVRNSETKEKVSNWIRNVTIFCFVNNIFTLPYTVERINERVKEEQKTENPNSLCLMNSPSSEPNARRPFQSRRGPTTFGFSNGRAASCTRRPPHIRPMRTLRTTNGATVIDNRLYANPSGCCWQMKLRDVRTRGQARRNFRRFRARRPTVENLFLAATAKNSGGATKNKNKKSSKNSQSVYFSKVKRFVASQYPAQRTREI